MQPNERTPVDYIEVTRRTYDGLGYPPYQWVHSEDPPAWAPLDKPLSQWRVGLIASGGIYRQGQIAFHFRDDASYRVIGRDVPTEELRATHFAYDLRDARSDINVVFPIDGLRALVAEGFIGDLAEESYTFMGGIYSARRVREQLAPAFVQRMVDQEVDVVLLVPVWPVCHQSVGLIARDLEAAGIPTLSMTSAWSITEAARVPRAAFVDYPLGHTVGQPHDPAGQLQLLRTALSCFTTIERPETIVDLGLEWGDDAWREQPLRGASRTATPAAAGGRRASTESADSRVERYDTPQYQTEADRAAAEARHGEEVACRACVGFDA